MYSPVPVTLFQFTPLREGRPLWNLQVSCLHFYFNSRPCVRGDKRKRKKIPILANFNSRPCVRGDLNLAVFINSFKIFQFTPLREGRPRPPPRWPWAAWYFNSRPCVRGDKKFNMLTVVSQDFNSRPCVRGDVQAFAGAEGEIVFQFTPLREGRPNLSLSSRSVPMISIHAPA